MQQFLQFTTWRSFIIQHVSGVLTPIIRSPVTAVAASGFTVGAWRWQCCWSWSDRPANGKTRGCYCSWWAPGDGRENAENLLSCKWTSSGKLEKLLHLVGWFIWIVWWCTDLQTWIYKRIAVETKYGRTYVMLNATSMEFKKYRL
jgi:hypothetical protein